MQTLLSYSFKCFFVIRERDTFITSSALDAVFFVLVNISHAKRVQFDCMVCIAHKDNLLSVLCT